MLISSGSIVMRDREPNSVYAGVTARKIGMFKDFYKKEFLGSGKACMYPIIIVRSWQMKKLREHGKYLEIITVNDEKTDM